MYILSKSIAISLIVHLKNLDDEILGNSFLGLNMNVKGLLSDFSKNFRPFLATIPPSTQLLVLFFQHLEQFVSVDVKFSCILLGDLI